MHLTEQWKDQKDSYGATKVHYVVAKRKLEFQTL